MSSPKRLLNRFHVAFELLLQGACSALVFLLHSWHRGNLVNLHLIVQLIGHLDLVTDQRLPENGLFDLIAASQSLILFLLLLISQTVWHLSRVKCLFQTIFDFFGDLVTLFLVLFLDEVTLLPHKIVVEPLCRSLEIVCTAAASFICRLDALELLVKLADSATKPVPSHSELVEPI